MKKIAQHILYLLPLSLIISACGSADSSETETKEKLQLYVKTEEVANKTFIHEIKVQGNVETDQDVLLTAEMGGLITSVNVKSGQHVSKGQVIAQVDASVLSSSKQELETQLEYAEYMLEKQEELNKRGVGSDFDLEAAKSQVNSLKASIESISTRQGKATIRAPFSGVIDQVFAKQGQMAGPSSPLVRLVNNESVDITAMISEKHLANVHVGTPIEVTFPNFKDTTIKLQITSVGNFIEPTNRTFRIMASIPKNNILLPNMLAEVHITDFEVKNGLVVSSNSVLKDQNSEDFVYVAKKTGDGLYKVKKTNITVIESYNGESLVAPSKEIKEGLLIVAEGARGITDGDIVTNKKQD